MGRIDRVCLLSLLPILLVSAAAADETVLFNGKNLEGWTFQVREGEEHPQPVEDVWVVENGNLISTGICDGFLWHQDVFEDYVLTFEWRSMRANRNGMIIGGSGSIFLHATDEAGSFHCPKSVEFALFNGVGSVYFRDVEPFSDEQWAFRAADFVDDHENELGEWNEVQLICNGKRLTAFLNGTPVAQIDGLKRSKGQVVLQSQRGSFAAPSYYRNLRVEPLSAKSAKAEAMATTRLAGLKRAEEEKEAARVAARREEERREAMRAAELEKAWATIEVEQEIEFTEDARQLPFPKNIKKMEFDATFGDIEFFSKTPLSQLSKFYRTEMARRGWEEVERDRDEDSVELVFQHGDAEVEVDLDADDDGVDVSLNCRGLSFEGTNDPAGLVTLGLPQPRSYLFLQKEIELPDDIRDLQYEGGNRCLFKSGLAMEDVYAFLGDQLRGKGYRETRRPIIEDDRNYTVFGKGPAKISVNIFTHEVGSRAIVTHERR